MILFNFDPVNSKILNYVSFFHKSISHLHPSSVTSFIGNSSQASRPAAVTPCQQQLD